MHMEYHDFKEVFQDVLPIIYKAAPLIGSYFGSPATGAIVGLLGAITQCNPCDHCALAQKLKDDPDLYAKLQTLESTHAEWVKKLSS